MSCSHCEAVKAAAGLDPGVLCAALGVLCAALDIGPVSMNKHHTWFCWMNFESQEVDCHSILVLMPLCRIIFLLVQNVQVDMCLCACVNTIECKCARCE